MKKEEITRQRNLLLSKEIDELKIQLAEQKELNSETVKKANDIILQLDGIRNVWLKSLEEVIEQKKRYKQLIREVTELRNNIKGRNVIERCFYKIKRK